MKLLENKTAIITVATRGIGRNTLLISSAPAID